MTRRDPSEIGQFVGRQQDNGFFQYCSVDEVRALLRTAKEARAVHPYVGNGVFIINPKPQEKVWELLSNDKRLGLRTEHLFKYHNPLPDKVSQIVGGYIRVLMAARHFYHKNNLPSTIVAELGKGDKEITFVRKSYIDKKKLKVTGKIFEQGMPNTARPYFHKKQRNDVRRMLTMLFGDRLKSVNYYYPGKIGGCPVISIRWDPAGSTLDSIMQTVESLFKSYYGAPCIKKMFLKSQSDGWAGAQILNVHLNPEWFLLTK